MRIPSWICASALLLVTQAAPALAQPPSSVPDRVRGSQRVVVATVEDVKSAWKTNEHGDQLIVSTVRLRVEEALKGKQEPAVSMEMLGGTVDGITLEVSSLPKMTRGERGVFFLEADAQGALVPHKRGQGILKLDEANRVRGTSLDLKQIREMAATAGGR